MRSSTGLSLGCAVCTCCTKLIIEMFYLLMFNVLVINNILIMLLIIYYFPVLCWLVYTKNIICQINVVICSVCLLH